MTSSQLDNITTATTTNSSTCSSITEKHHHFYNLFKIKVPKHIYNPQQSLLAHLCSQYSFPLTHRKKPFNNQPNSADSYYPEKSHKNHKFHFQKSKRILLWLSYRTHGVTRSIFLFCGNKNRLILSGISQMLLCRYNVCSTQVTLHTFGQ